MKYGPNIEIEGDTVRCAHCEESLGDVSENVRRNLAIEETSIKEAGPRYVDPSRFVSEDMVFRKFYCPGCAVMLFTESAKADAPVLDGFDIAIND